jgi:hypothetical protein
MDDFQKRIEQKLDTLLQGYHAMDKTLILQNQQLKEHMRRTRANEKTLQKFEERFDLELAPIRDHVKGLNYILKAFGVTSLLLTVALGGTKFYEWLYEKPDTPPKGETQNAPVPEVRPPKPGRKK